MAFEPFDVRLRVIRRNASEMGGGFAQSTFENPLVCSTVHDETFDVEGDIAGRN